MKKIIIPILILGAIGIAIGFYMYNKPVQSLEKKKAEVMISASQLVTEYEADETAANEKYLGKVVEVSGKIADIVSEEGKTKIQLETSNPMAMVICEMEDGSDTGLNEGDEAKIKGLCSGYLSDVILVQCVSEKL